MKRLLPATVLLLACASPPADGPPPPRLVVTAPAHRGDAVDRVVLLGDVEGEVDVRVFADVPERVRELHVREGDAVRAGQPIATLEASMPSADVAQADAALLAAEASRDRLRGDVERTSPLVERAAIAQSQLDALEAQLRAAEAQVAQLTAGRRVAGLRRARSVVRAPIDGVLADLGPSVGDLVGPQLPIARVVRMDRVNVLVSVVEEDFVRLREGMAVQVRPTARPDVVREGRVARLSPVLDRLSRTGRVEIAVENADHALRPGMVAEVAIELDRRQDVVLVPSRAVLMSARTASERSAFVFVAEGGRATRRAVMLGQRYPGEGDETRVEIREGLEGGETVVVEGHHVLRDGAAVRVNAPATEG